MTSRVPDHICAVFWIGGICCLLGLIKGLIGVILSLLFLPIPSFTIALGSLLFNFPRSYYVLLTTPKLGPNLKALAFLSLWSVFLLGPSIVLLASCIWAMIMGFGPPFMETFDADVSLWFGGYTSSLDLGKIWIKDIWTGATKTLNELLDEYRDPARNANMQVSQNQPAPPGGMPLEPFDIPLLVIIKSLFVGTCLGICVGIGCSLVALVHFIPLTTRLYYYLWEWFLDEDSQDGCLMRCCWRVVFLLPFLLLNLLIPIICALAMLMVSVGSFFGGCFFCTVACYARGICAARIEAIQTTRKVETALRSYWSSSD